MKMIISFASIAMGIIGISFIFLPDFIIHFLMIEKNSLYQSVLQVAGSAFLGFAAFNWMSRERPTGGIYNRPLVIANLMHWLTGSLVLVRYVTSADEIHISLIGFTVVYILFSILFSITLFTNPKKLMA